MRIAESTTLRLLLSCVFVFAVLSCRQAGAQDSPPFPSPFQGDLLPAPPQQDAPWTPPSGPSSALLSATTSLFDEGLADPRGCDYRQISIAFGRGIVQTHGWALPVSTPDAPRFAVCWNGLVYPALSVGEPADLPADVDKLIADDAARLAAEVKNSPGFPLWRETRVGFSEDQGISIDSFLPLKSCLLLRLGETTLAQRFWTEWAAGMSPNVNNNTSEAADPYLMLAGDWAWASFDRSIDGHIDGNDRLALISAQQLTAVQPKIEAEAARRGYARPDFGTPDKPSPYLFYFSDLPALLADEQRRVLEPPRPHAVVAQSPGFPEMAPPPVDQSPPADKAKRVALLVADLENVHAGPGSLLGGISLGTDPIVKSIIGEGDDAVEPLLDVLAHDDRLTRCVEFWHGDSRVHSLVSVREATYAALVGILQTSVFSTIDTRYGLTSLSAAERAQLADKIRAYWLKHKGQSQEERWYQTLADDSAPPGQWLQAAEKIVQPDTVFTAPEGSWVTESVLAPDTKPPGLRGASLRAGHSPSVADLMARRTAQIMPPPGSPNDSDRFAQMENATEMALLLSAWDVRAAVTVLRTQMAHCQALLRRWNDPAESGRFALDYSYMTEARLRGHDPLALADYGRWLRGIRAEELRSFGSLAPFAPLWENADDPSMRAAAKSLFDSPHALLSSLNGDPRGLDDFITSPLLNLPVYRQRVLRGLSDPTPSATLTINKQGDADISFKNKGSGDYPMKTSAPVGTKVVVRRSDWVAWNLAKVEGMQAFDLLWPQPRRNSAIAADAATLRQYGGGFRYDPRLSKLWDDLPEARAHLTFARLTCPATVADVKAGRAVFTLGSGAKVAPLPSFPAKAQLITSGPTAGTAPPPGINGWVWQSEEDASGHRFYGFIGPGILAREPASTVRFLP